MPEVTQNQEQPADKRPLEILRERRGGVPRHLVERNREQAAHRRRIIDALKTGAKTVPEIAQATNLPPHEAFWHLMSMKKYGRVMEGEQREDYFEYALAEETKTTENAS